MKLDYVFSSRGLSSTDFLRIKWVYFAQLDQYKVVRIKVPMHWSWYTLERYRIDVIRPMTTMQYLGTRRIVL